MKVVNLRKEKFTHYIGRPNCLGNPFVIGKDGTREEVIAKYENYVRQNIFLMSEMNKLPDDAVLGCYCKPLPCHGDVIVKIADELRRNRRKK